MSLFCTAVKKESNEKQEEESSGEQSEDEKRKVLHFLMFETPLWEFFK